TANVFDRCQSTLQVRCQHDEYKLGLNLRKAAFDVVEIGDRRTLCIEPAPNEFAERGTASSQDLAADHQTAHAGLSWTATVPATSHAHAVRPSGGRAELHLLQQLAQKIGWGKR